MNARIHCKICRSIVTNCALIIVFNIFCIIEKYRICWIIVWLNSLYVVISVNVISKNDITRVSFSSASKLRSILSRCCLLYSSWPSTILPRPATRTRPAPLTRPAPWRGGLPLGRLRGGLTGSLPRTFPAPSGLPLRPGGLPLWRLGIGGFSATSISSRMTGCSGI